MKGDMSWLEVSGDTALGKLGSPGRSFRLRKSSRRAKRENRVASGQVLDPPDGDLPGFARRVQVLIVPAAVQLNVLGAS
jgi:hypothetical protein